MRNLVDVFAIHFLDDINHFALIRLIQDIIGVFGIKRCVVILFYVIAVNQKIIIHSVGDMSGGRDVHRLIGGRNGLHDLVFGRAHNDIDLLAGIYLADLQHDAARAHIVLFFRVHRVAFAHIIKPRIIVIVLQIISGIRAEYSAFFLLIHFCVSAVAVLHGNIQWSRVSLGGIFRHDLVVIFLSRIKGLVEQVGDIDIRAVAAVSVITASLFELDSNRDLCLRHLEGVVSVSAGSDSIRRSRHPVEGLITVRS